MPESLKAGAQCTAAVSSPLKSAPSHHTTSNTPKEQDTAADTATTTTTSTSDATTDTATTTTTAINAATAINNELSLVDILSSQLMGFVMV